MKCSRCGSENMQMQAKNAKNYITIGVVLALVGFGLMFLGIIGAILGIAIGIPVGVILKMIIPTPRETIGVCQTCGYTTTPINQDIVDITGHPLSAVDGNENFVITREASSFGALVNLKIIVDNFAPITLTNGMTVYLKVAEKEKHTIFFEQINGLGKKKRKGIFDIYIEEHSKRYITFVFTQNGIKVK